MRSTASPPQFKILNSKFKIQNSNCKASPCLSFRASRGIFTMRNFVSPPSFFFFLSSFFFARLRLACVNGDGPFLQFILLRQVREHCMNFFHTQRLKGLGRAQRPSPTQLERSGTRTNVSPARRLSAAECVNFN